MFSRRPAKKPLLSKEDRAAFPFKLDLEKILFSDETRYKMFNSDGMRRPINTRFDPKNLIPIYFINDTMDRFIYGDIM